ncbi:MAG: hypothetical protein ACOYXB_14155 [Bacteroidota bacterium]
MKNRSKYLLVSSLILFAGMQLYGQQEEVVVIKPYDPTLSGAEKIDLLPVMGDTVNYRQPVFEYRVFPKRFETEFKVNPIQPAKMVQMPLPKLYKSELNLGVGNYLTPLAELTINQLRSKDGSMGLRLRHHSMNGKVRMDDGTRKEAGFSDNDLEFFGARYMNNTNLEYRIGGNYNSVVQYGVDSLITDTLTRKELTSPYYTGFASLSLYSAHADSFHLNYRADLAYYIFSHNLEQVEHGAYLEGSFDKALRKQTIGAELGVRYYRHQPEWDSVSTNVVLVKINPWIAMSSSEWSFIAGINTYSGVRNGDFVPHFYPRAKFQFNIVKEVLVPYFGVDGYMQTNTYRNMAMENPYINPTVYAQPTNYQLVAYGGLKGRFTDKVAWNIRGSYSIIQDMYFFRLDSTVDLRNQFTVLYDDVQLANVYAELAIYPKKDLSILLKGNYYNYVTVSEDYAWFKPSFDASLEAKYNMGDKILTEASLFVIGPRYYDAFDSFNVPGKLPATVDLNLGVEYRYTGLLSFWVRVNNMLAQRYYLYNQYPSFRFRLMAGFTYTL